jgi:hypothetical protein
VKDYAKQPPADAEWVPVGPDSPDAELRKLAIESASDRRADERTARTLLRSVHALRMKARARHRGLMPESAA